MTRNYKYRIAYFISPHGYGHAARAAAVMEAVYELDPEVAFDIFTQVPRWFFEDSLSGNFGYFPLLTDIGLVQKTPLQADLSETLRQLDQFLPLDFSIINNLADKLKEMKCRMIICDISPVGIEVAKRASIPSVLVENFTWDWIYQEYEKYDGRMKRHIGYLKGLFDKADFHVQTEPVCLSCNADLTTFPVSRKMRIPANEIKKKMGIPHGTKVVMITMGGIPEQYPFLKQLAGTRDNYYVIPGVGSRMEIHGNLVLLPHHSDYFHPDLVNASDAVIGKVGYSTVAEVYCAGVPFGYIVRKKFPESGILASFIDNQMKGLPIDEQDFYNGNWISSLPDLLAMPRLRRQSPRGSEQIARFICGLLTNPSTFCNRSRVSR